MRFGTVYRWLLIFVWGAWTQLASAQGPDAAAVFQALEEISTKVVEQAEPCVVAVSRISIRQTANVRSQIRNPFGLVDEPVTQSQNPLKSGFIPTEFGTGVLVSPRDKPGERYVLTNYHLVRGGRTFRNPDDNYEVQLFVQLHKFRACEATIYAADPRSDLAVLKLDIRRLGVDSENELPAIPLFDGESVKKGQFVFAIGNPYAIARDGSPSVSYGMVSNHSRLPFIEPSADKTMIHQYGTLLSIDMRLNVGTSGGVLLNRHGELIGITTALAALQGYESSVGFAIPVNRTTRRIVDALLAGFEVEYGFLGVQLRTDDVREGTYGIPRFQRTAVRVTEVLENYPADLGDLRKGDLVVAINGRPVFTLDDVMREVGLAGPNAKLQFQVIRGESGVRPIHVTLGKWPVKNPTAIVTARDRYPKWRGLKVDWPTAREEHMDHSRRYPDGVLVLEVEPSSSAFAAQIRPGQIISNVNDRPVRTPDQFHETVKTLKGEVRCRIFEGGMVTLR